MERIDKQLKAATTVNANLHFDCWKHSM